MTAGRRDRLASALVVAAASTGSYEAHDLADALLPVVDRMIRQAQAEALESAADDPRLDSAFSSCRRRLRDRAAVLRLTTDHPDVTQDAP